MELFLTRHDAHIQAQVNGSASHEFSIHALDFSRDDPLATRYDPQPYGARLYAALFPRDSAAARALADAPDALLLVIDDAELQRVPWEYLYDGQTFLALKMPLTRGLPPAKRVTFDASANQAGNVLVVASDPLLYEDGAPVVALNVARERENARAAFEKSNAAFRVTFVKPPTRDELQKALARAQPPALLHFLGHGVAASDGARLAFEDTLSQAQSVDAVELLAPAREKLFCVYFNSCETATSLDSTASNLAHTLAAAGVPYVLGMQFKVPEIAALRLSEFFYLHLAQGETIERAVWQARRELWNQADLQTVLAPDGETIDLRAFCLGIPVLYSALDAPSGIRVPAGAAEIQTVHPRREFDPLIPPPQVFRGRRAELVAIGRMLERGYATEQEVDEARRRDGRVPEGARVIVLRGEGGMGKSTLARRAAEHFDWRFPDGILGISLEDIPAADALGARLGKFLMNDDAADQAAVVDAARTRRALLILDNYETLAEKLAARDETARALARLIAQLAGGETVLLLTSRVTVNGLAGAQELEIEGLEIGAGRTLFWDYCPKRRRDADDSIVADIVERVGGHPLAIELIAAAYQASSLGLPDFARDLNAQLARAENFYKNERHATLAGCFDYTYQFLPSAAQTLFPKLRLFQAPFLAEFVKFIFETEDAGKILHTLESKSLIRAQEFGEDTPLYFLHPMARWYAGERGQRARTTDSAAQDAATDERISARTTEDAAQDAATDERIGAVASVHPLQYPLAADGARYGEMYYNLARATFESFAGKTDVGIVQLARVTVADLIAAREFLPNDNRIRHDQRLGYILQNFGWMRQADELLEEGLALAQEGGDNAAQSSALFEQARLAVTRGDLDGAMRLYQQSAAIDEQLGDQKGKAATLHQMAGIFVTRGDLDGAMRLYQQSLQIKEQLGDLQGKAVTLANMASFLEGQDKLEEALAFYTQSFEISRELKDLFGLGNVLRMMSSALLKNGKAPQALGALIDSLNIFVQMQLMQEANRTANALARMKESVGENEFSRLWQAVTGNDEQPEWLRG